MPTISGIREIPIPKIKEANISPRRIVEMEIGQDANLSKVFICVSHGVITGETEVDVNKIVIPSKPDIRKLVGIFLPIIKAANRNIGNRIPKMITGPFK